MQNTYAFSTVKKLCLANWETVGHLPSGSGNPSTSATLFIGLPVPNGFKCPGQEDGSSFNEISPNAWPTNKTDRRINRSSTGAIIPLRGGLICGNRHKLPYGKRKFFRFHRETTHAKKRCTSAVIAVFRKFIGQCGDNPETSALVSLDIYRQKWSRLIFVGS